MSVHLPHAANGGNETARLSVSTPPLRAHHHQRPGRGVDRRALFALAVIRCGRFSLQVFSFGALLSSFAVVSLILSGNNQLIQTLVCIAGVGAQLAYAAWRDRVREESGPVDAPAAALVAVRTQWRRRDR